MWRLWLERGEAVVRARRTLTARLAVLGLAAGAAAPAGASAALSASASAHVREVSREAPSAVLGGFSVRPAEFNAADPATRAYFKPVIRAGGAFTGKVIVTNSRAVALKLRVSAVDGLTGSTSGVLYGDRRDPLHRAGVWLTPSVSLITVEPHRQRLVAFTVRVPRSAWPGDHVAGIVVESADPPRTRGRFSVTEVFRVALGVQVRVPGTAGAAVRLVSARLGPAAGSGPGSVVIVVANRGRLLCRPSLAVALRGGGGARVVTRRLDTILPGDSIPYPVPLPSTLAPGDYHLSVHADDCGRRASLQGTVRAGRTFTASATRSASQRPAAQSATAWSPLALAGTGGLLAGIASGIAVYLLRRKAKPERPTSDTSGLDTAILSLTESSQ